MTGLGSQNGPMPTVGFVVVNWNQRQLTLDCLASLGELEYPEFSVLLVDNGSEDGSQAAIRETFPEVVVLENKVNLGIAAANNVGIRYALENGADYVFLLNNDTVVDPQMLKPLVTVAESDPTIGMTGPTILYFDQPDLIWSAGSQIDWTNGRSLLLRKGKPFASTKNTTCLDVDFITSCAICIKRAVFEEIGLMDECYFIYYDETDWSARAGAAGWRSVYVPWAKMWHKVSATMGENSPTTDYYMVRNCFRFLAKNLRGVERIAALANAAFDNIRAIVAYTIRSHGGRRLRNRNAKAWAMRDAILRRWGPMDAKLATLLRSEHR